MAFVALLVLPHSLVTAAALLMGCAESLRMSLLIAGQLLPNAANCGGLWQDFRLYCMRFLLLVGVAFRGRCARRRIPAGVPEPVYPRLTGGCMYPSKIPDVKKSKEKDNGGWIFRTVRL